MGLQSAVVSYLYTFGLFEGSSWSFDSTPVQTKFHELIGDTIDGYVQDELVDKVKEVELNLGVFGGLVLSRLNTGDHHYSISFPNDDASRVKSGVYRGCHADLSYVSYKGYKTTKFHFECKKKRYCVPTFPGMMHEDENDISSPLITFDWSAHPCVPKVSSSIDVYIMRNDV